MAYMVARTEKRKVGDLAGYQIHVDRKTENHENKDIDNERSYLNYDLIGHEKSTSFKTEIIDYINENKSSTRAVRKDAVVLQDWLISSSQDFFDLLSESETKRYFKVALSYFQEKFGAENVRFATVHMDELTPHMHLGIVPFNSEKRLTSKTIFTRECLRTIQDELPKMFQENGFDIERGKEKSAAEHVRPEVFKKMAQAETEVEKISEKVNNKYIELAEVKQRIERQESRGSLFAQQIWHDEWLDTKQAFPGFKMRVPEELKKQECHEIDENTAKVHKLNFGQVFRLFQEKFTQAKEYIASKWQKLTVREQEIEKRYNKLENEESALKEKSSHFKAESTKLIDKLDIFSEELSKKEILLQTQTNYLDRMAEVSEISLAMPDYVKPSRMNKDMLIVPKEKWLAKHVAANAYHEMDDMRLMLFESKRKIEEQTKQRLSNYELSIENKKLKREVNVLNADNSAFRDSFSTLFFEDKLDVDVAKTLNLPIDFKRELGLVERPSQRWTIEREFDGPSLG